MLQNAYFLAKIGADTAGNEQHLAEILPTDALDGGGAISRVAFASLAVPSCAGGGRECSQRLRFFDKLVIFRTDFDEHV